jgi:outer membrane protein OmpA-like peptidoglycan-associated protein
VRLLLAVFVVLAAIVGAAAWLEGDRTHVADQVVAEHDEIAPATDPTPRPTPTPTAAPVPDGTPTPTPTTTAAPTEVPDAVVDVLADRPELSQLVELLGRAGLGELLGGAGPVTLFAPTDDAFAALPPALSDAVAADATLVQQLLANHVVSGLVTTDDLATGAPVETEGGDLVDPTDVQVVDGDLDGGNGVVHVIDSVLVPEAVAVQVELNGIVLAEPIQFEAGVTDLVAASQATLDRVAAVMLEHPDLAIEIQGHTDTDGDDATNEVLSAGRAEVVLAYLVATGVPESQLTAVGYGETELIVDPEVTPEDKARNRRIEFRAT